MEGTRWLWVVIVESRLTVALRLNHLETQVRGAPDPGYLL